MASLAQQYAEAQLRLIGFERLKSLPLVEVVPYLSPQYEEPRHLPGLLDIFERIRAGESVRALNSCPPQVGKTNTILHALVQIMACDPTKHHAYVSYGADYAHGRSRLARDLARAAGLQLRDDSTAVNHWHLREGGSLLSTGVGGALTGYTVDGVMIFDDPYSSRQQAESQAWRDKVYEDFTSKVFSRAHASTSIVVQHARWHPDDLIGRLEPVVDPADPEHARKLWPYTNIPAINEAGEPLWPSHQPMWLLEQKRQANAYDWWSLYMGQPRSRGGAVFRDTYFYDALPASYRVGAGVDLAYTTRKASDWCVIVVMAESNGTYYVLDVRREQSDPPTFSQHFRQVKAAYPGSKWLWYTSTTELGVADLLREQSGFPIRGEIAKSDKFVRAQPFAALWNAGKVLVPRDKPWVAQFVSELMNFTGVNDKQDDQVDAGAAAIDVLGKAMIAVPRAFPTKFTKQAGSGPVFPQGDKGGGFVW